MRFSVKLILDIPYSSFSERTIRIAADDIESLITLAIPKRACREVERLKETTWEEIGWKHINMKFDFHDIQIEFVFDQEKRNVVAPDPLRWSAIRPHQNKSSRRGRNG